MKRAKFYSIGALAVLAVGVYAENRHFALGRQTMMTVIDPAKAVMEPAPIPADWVLEGKPVTKAAEIAHTDDGSTHVYVWQTTASRFNWFYDADEIVQVLDGEVFVTDETGIERRIGPGDVAFFPVGARTSWRVPDHLRKIATLKRALPGPLASLMRWGRTAKRWAKPKVAFAGD